MIRAALAYADAGFPVFPCRSTSDKAKGSKAPHLPGESAPGAKDGGHWLASTDPKTVEGWWRRWPDALIGFPTGARSRTVVIDLDPKEAQPEDMCAALFAWCGGLAGHDPATGEVLRPAVAVTQSGGLHLYYVWPGDAEFAEVARNLAAAGRHEAATVGNRANLFRDFIRHGEAPAVLAHIDVRGEGGYVIAPPSVMENGAAYRWLRKPDKGFEGRWLLPALPVALRRVLTHERIPRAVVQEQRAARDAARRFEGVGIDDVRVRRYVASAIDGVLASARAAPAGQRNETVFKAASRLSCFVRSGHLGSGEAESLLLANLPTGVSPAEKKIRQTISRGLASTELDVFSPEQLRVSA